MLDSLIALFGVIISFLGAYTLYIKAIGKNKVDIGEMVNKQIDKILETKNNDIADLKTDLGELREKYDALSDKVQELLNKRMEDQATISNLTIELADAVRDGSYWKRLYEEMKEKYEDMKRRFKDE